MPAIQLTVIIPETVEILGAIERLYTMAQDLGYGELINPELKTKNPSIYKRVAISKMFGAIATGELKIVKDHSKNK